MNVHCLGCITILVYTAQSRIYGDTFTDYSPVLLFYTPRKHQPLGFLFSGGIEKQHRAVMGRNSVFFVIYRSNQALRKIHGTAKINFSYFSINESN